MLALTAQMSGHRRETCQEVCEIKAKITSKRTKVQVQTKTLVLVLIPGLFNLLRYKTVHPHAFIFDRETLFAAMPY